MCCCGQLDCYQPECCFFFLKKLLFLKIGQECFGPIRRMKRSPLFFFIFFSVCNGCLKGTIQKLLLTVVALKVNSRRSSNDGERNKCRLVIGRRAEQSLKHVLPVNVRASCRFCFARGFFASLPASSRPSRGPLHQRFNQLMNDGTDEGFSGVTNVTENQPHQSSFTPLKMTVPSTRVFVPDEVRSGGSQSAGCSVFLWAFKE